VWENGVMTDLGTLTPGQGFSTAHSINNAGQIVGRSIIVSGEEHAVIREDGRIRDLGTTGGEFTRSEANDINNAGQIVGNASGPGPVARAFLIRGGVTSLVPTLGGGERNTASAINDAGQVVGASATAGEGADRAYLYNSGDGTIVDLGSLPGEAGSSANDVNNLGQVVGDARGGSGVFLWEDGVMLDLAELIDPDSGWTLSTAKAINDDGWIIGTGDNPAGESAGFLMTPIDDGGGGPNPIPLPPAAWSALSVLAGLSAHKAVRARLK
jgi:probable HAF family extracellular repeat protein